MEPWRPPRRRTGSPAEEATPSTRAIRQLALVALLALSMPLSAPRAQEPADAEAKWDRNRVVVLSIKLEQLVGEIHTALVVADATATVMESRARAAAMDHLRDLKTETERLVKMLEAGGEREDTEPIVQRIESLRSRLRAKADEGGFGSEAVGRIIEARHALEELATYYQ